MGLALIILAFVLMLITLIFIPATLIWNVLAFWKKGWAGRNSRYLAEIALAIDQGGNVYLKVVLNRWMIKAGAVKKYFFGDSDDTISFVTAMNYFRNNLTKFGMWVGRTLDKADPDHMKKSIINKIKRDIEAFERLKEAGLISDSIETPQVLHDSHQKYIDNITIKNIEH